MVRANAQNTDRGTNNVFLGATCGNFTTTANRTTGMGNTCLVHLTSGSDNTCFGYVTGESYTTAARNVAIGGLAHTDAIASSDCTSVGYIALTTSTSGNQNTAIGSNSLGSLSTGGSNIAVGYQAGNSYVAAESSNICIGNTGTAAESNICRIGTTGSSTGQQTDSYIAGNVRAGTKFIFPAETTVYVNGQTGNDSTGDGSPIYPYATIVKANSVILDNATGKRYTIRHTGSTTEVNLTLKPWTSIVGDSVSGSQITITGTGELQPDITWDGVVGGVASVSNVTFTGSSGIDFQIQAFSGSAATLYISNVIVPGSLYFQGRSSSLETVNLFNVISNSVSGGIVTQDFNGTSSNSHYSVSQFAQSSAGSALTWQSNNDYFSGALTVQRGSANLTASIYASSIQGLLTVNGSGAVVHIDPISYPQGGITLASSGIVTYSLVSSASGGTGVNNGSSTLTLGGNLATSGAFASTFTITAPTTVTFPTSGTLATTSQIPSGSALTKADDTNVTLSLGGSPTTALVNAASITAGWTGQLSAARGGTGASNTATTGTILRGNGTNFVPTTATYPATATGTGTILRADGTNWSATTATYPTTTTANQLLYSSATNTVGGLSSAANGVLVTDGSSVPSISSTLPTAVQGNITSTGTLGATTFSGLITATAGGIQSWAPIGANTYTNTTYTFALTDQDTYIRFSNASAQTVTIPANATVAFPVGTEINGIQAGAGQVTFAAAGGVTVNSKGAVLSISGQYGGFSLKKYGTDTWDLIVG